MVTFKVKWDNPNHRPVPMSMIFVREDGRLYDGSSELGSVLDGTKTVAGMVTQVSEDDLTVMMQGVVSFPPPSNLPYFAQPDEVDMGDTKITLPDGQETTLDELAIQAAFVEAALEGQNLKERFLARKAQLKSLDDDKDK